jgi:hypothetical protein
MGLTYLISLKKNRKRRHPLAGDETFEETSFAINHGPYMVSRAEIIVNIIKSRSLSIWARTIKGKCERAAFVAAAKAQADVQASQGCCIIEQGFLLARAHAALYPLMIMGVRREKRDTIAE